MLEDGVLEDDAELDEDELLDENELEEPRLELWEDDGLESDELDDRLLLGSLDELESKAQKHVPSDL